MELLTLDEPGGGGWDRSAYDAALSAHISMAHPVAKLNLLFNDEVAGAAERLSSKTAGDLLSSLNERRYSDTVRKIDDWPEQDRYRDELAGYVAATRKYLQRWWR